MTGQLTVRERTERATEQAYVINPGGSVVDLLRANAFPTREELERAVEGELDFHELEGHQGITLVYAGEPWPTTRKPRRNGYASRLVGRTIYGPVAVVSKRLLR